MVINTTHEDQVQGIRVSDELLGKLYSNMEPWQIARQPGDVLKVLFAFGVQNREQVPLDQAMQYVDSQVTDIN